MLTSDCFYYWTKRAVFFFFNIWLKFVQYNRGFFDSTYSFGCGTPSDDLVTFLGGGGGNIDASTSIEPFLLFRFNSYLLDKNLAVVGEVEQQSYQSWPIDVFLLVLHILKGSNPEYLDLS